MELYYSSETNVNARDVLPADYSAKSTVHEYGGGSFITAQGGKLVFTSHPTNGVFSLDPSSGEINTIVKPSAKVRFGNFNIHPISGKWILAVREIHNEKSVVNTAVAINTQTGDVVCIAEGADFYQHVQFNPDGTRVCWTQWNHPDMPWTGSLLFTSSWDSEGDIPLKGTLISGKAGVESICQPRWSPDGTLFFVSDKTDFWQLYRLDEGTTTPRLVLLKGLEEAEFGIREPTLGV